MHILYVYSYEIMIQFSSEKVNFLSISNIYKNCVHKFDKTTNTFVQNGTKKRAAALF